MNAYAIYNSNVYIKAGLAVSLCKVVAFALIILPTCFPSLYRTSLQHSLLALFKSIKYQQYYTENIILFLFFKLFPPNGVSFVTQNRRQYSSIYSGTDSTYHSAHSRHKLTARFTYYP